MNPGRLNRRIEIWARQEETNEMNETDYVYSKKNTIWAAIIPQTGKLQSAPADTILSNTTHKIIVRYNAGKNITQSMYIVFKGHKFDIKYILNPYYENEYLEVFCEEVIE
jgi:SPP1 family predicted phage head-tail adaptor